MMDNLTPYQRAKLLLRYLRDELNDQELADMQAWLKEHPEQQQFVDRLINDRGMEAHYTLLSNIDQPVAWNSLQQKLELGSKRKALRLWPRIAIAAAVAAIVVSAGMYFYNNSERGVLKQVQDDVVYKQDIAPGKNTATLTMPDGTIVNLSEAKSGVVVNDKLTYSDGTNINHPSLPTRGISPQGGERITSITATTPRGGTYSIILQDGTKVWLNADSKLEFLSNYRNKLQRIVKVEGEAYFEVAKNKAKPFIVESEGQRITVLGTHFNISAYKGEGIRTTLLEGSVKVSTLHSLSASGGEMGEAQRGGGNNNNSSLPTGVSPRGGERMAVTLKPNQQAILKNNTIDCIQVDATEAIAWKNGKFRFNDASLEEVMKQLSRWYDVDVVYPNGVPERSFTGGINRNITAAEALSLFQFSNVKFKIEGKKIIVNK